MGLPASFARSLLAGAGFEGVAAGRGVVRRPGLLERLLAARAGGVVLVCAPAGSGKSVLVRSWAEAEGLGDRVAWVSVEPGEPDGQRFWLSVIDALARVAASVRRSLLRRWLGRLDAVERRLERAQRVLQPDGEPGHRVDRAPRARSPAPCAGPARGGARGVLGR